MFATVHLIAAGLARGAARWLAVLGPYRSLLLLGLLVFGVTACDECGGGYWTD